MVTWWCWNAAESKITFFLMSCSQKLIVFDNFIFLSMFRFMSISRGWWLAWSSTDPRRSGAFTIEIIEKAQSKFKEQLDKIKENISLSSSKETPQQAPMDNVLRPGDTFRLRSVKFPDFELGLTSVKVRDEYCYLGLRKMVVSFKIPILVII